MEEIEKLIEKLESKTLAFYSTEEIIEMLKDLKHTINENT